jgi:hypothetical protein
MGNVQPDQSAGSETGFSHVIGQLYIYSPTKPENPRNPVSDSDEWITSSKINLIDPEVI